jgi:hypothetical protein
MEWSAPLPATEFENDMLGFFTGPKRIKSRGCGAFYRTAETSHGYSRRYQEGASGVAG